MYSNSIMPWYPIIDFGPIDIIWSECTLAALFTIAAHITPTIVDGHGSSKHFQIADDKDSLDCVFYEIVRDRGRR